MKKIIQLGKRILSCLLIVTVLAAGLPEYAAEGAAEEEDICGPVIDPVTGSIRYHCIYFGNQGSNKMKWRVLSADEEELFLMADRAVANCKFGSPVITVGDNGFMKDVKNLLPWEKSSLRSWLNDAFIKETFTEEEQAEIISKPDGAGDFTDRVSLLSIGEIENDSYGFTSNDKVHKNSRILMADAGNAVSWWLKDGRVVGETGCIYNVSDYHYAVRPVIHINRHAKENWQDAGTIEISESQTDRQMPENPVIDEQNKTVTWDCIYFGHYYQDSTVSREPIKWRVLSVEGDDAYLIADQNLDSASYHPAAQSVNWGSCSLRDWLNRRGPESYMWGGFAGQAFGKEEQSGIIMNKNGDMVSLLSEDELHKPEYGFVPESESARGGCTRTAESTPYVKGTNSWWLRGGNDGGKELHYVDEDGTIRTSSISEEYSRQRAVRPTIHLDLKNSTWYRAESVRAYVPGDPGINTEQDTVTWDCIYFGQYYQDSEEEKEPIKWRILSADGDDVFLLADQNLDCQSYHDSQADTTWADCSLRSWLNQSFLQEAFSQEEQQAIADTELSDASGDGNRVVDKIFLLSASEACNAEYGFLPAIGQKSDSRIAGNTAHLEKVNPQMHGKEEADWWWLRTLGDPQNAVYIGGDGKAYLDGEEVSRKDYAVRPALHINLKDTSLWSWAEQTAAVLGTEEKPEETPEPMETAEPGETDPPMETTVPDGQTMPKNPVVKNGVTTWDCIYFGNYYQQNGTTKEAIKWRVLSVDSNNNAFLLADRNLDCQKYNASKKAVSWKDCTLRSWMNGYGKDSNADKKDYKNNNFLQNAFNQKEQAAIFRTKIKNGNNPYCGIKGGEQTTDKVYLLSISEASNAAYGFLTNFKNESDTRIATNTAYVKIRNASMAEAGKADWWWLRTPGDNSYRAARLGNRGGGYYYGNSVETAYIAVRPALHLNLNSTVWKNAESVSAGTGDSGNSSQTVLKKNAKVNDSAGNTYIVTQSNTNQREVAFASPKNKKIAKVTIPATIKVRGVKYQVTHIQANAFQKCKKLQKVSVGKNVRSIGKKAFYGCSGLRKLILHTRKLQLKKVGKKAFCKVNAQVKVDLPQKKSKAYRKMLKKRGLRGKAVTGC